MPAKPWMAKAGLPCRWLMVTVINPIVDFHHRVIIHAGRTPRSRRGVAVTQRLRALYAMGPAAKSLR